MIGYTTYTILRIIFGPQRAADMRLRARHRRVWTGAITVDTVCLAACAGIFLGAAIHGLITDYDGSEMIINHAEAAAPVARTVRIEVAIDWTRERVLQEVKTAASKYGVSYEKMYKTIACESNFNPEIQSHHTMDYGREESYGVAQFHIPSRNRTADGTVITKEMALNPAIALDAMAYHFSIGNQRLWTCYRNIYF